MARKKKNEVAEYGCVNYDGCVAHIPAPNGQGTVEQFFNMHDEDYPKDKQPYPFTYVSVSPDTIVNKHFEPINDVAEEARHDQVQNPGKYCKDEQDILMMAELLIKKGFYTHKNTAISAIKDFMGDQTLEKSDEAIRLDKIQELSKLGNDDKETRKKLGTMLRGGDITFFPGAPVQKLAELVVDNGLHEED